MRITGGADDWRPPCKRVLVNSGCQGVDSPGQGAGSRRRARRHPRIAARAPASVKFPWTCGSIVASARSLRVWLVTAGPDARREITGRLIPNAVGATGTLHAGDLQPGQTTIEATAKSWHDGTERGSSTFSWEPAVDLATANHCDVIAPTRCAMPFPNDFFTVPDRASSTGRRVHFDPASMTANSSGVRVDPTEWNRNDGFSPGSAIVSALVPGLDPVRTGARTHHRHRPLAAPEQPIVLLDADTGERWPFFAELDAQADPADRC